MVVVGAARGRSGGGVDEGKVCSVAYQRQHLHHQQHNIKSGIKQAAQGGDALPVVELKPFTKKVWRREKSLPNFYDKPVLKPDDSGSDSSRNARNGPPPNIVRYIRELSDQRKTVDTWQSVDSTQRYRSKLHPKADFSFEGWSVAEHQQDLIPSFIPRQERTKTTLGEDTATTGAAAAAPPPPGGSSACSGGMGGAVTDRSGGYGGAGTLGREVSNLMTTYTRDKPLQQQQVCLTGGKLSLGNLGRRPLLYLKPFSAYRQKQAWNVMRRENSPTTLSPRHAVSLSLSPRNSGGLGSSANGHPARRDLVLSGSSFYTPDRAQLQPLRMTQKSPHRFNSKLGAAQDSLMMLSRTGAPTVLERNLSFDQEVRLERCRRERSFAAVSETNVLSTAHYVAYDSQPTRGEVTLMKAREANKSRDGGKMVYRRNGLQKPVGAIPSFGQYHSNFMQGRVFDNSPRSNKSELGDSGIMSSPGEPGDDVMRAGEPAVGPGGFPRDLGEEPIPEHPGDSEVDDQEAEELPRAALHMWAPADSVAVLQGELGSDLVESTDEHRRPLSDSAANETVHVRNELTPMSAENKARMLPRDDSYVEVVEMERGRTSHRQRREGFVKDAGPVVDTTVARQLTQTELGAETVSKDTDASKSNGAEAPSLAAEQAESGQSQNEKSADRASEHTDTTTHPETSTLADTSELNSVFIATAQGPAASEALFSMVRSDSKQSLTADKDSARKVSQDNVNGQAVPAQDIELVSVNSSAPSYGALESARDPVSQPVAGPVIREHETENSEKNDTETTNTGSEPAAVVPGVSGTAKTSHSGRSDQVNGPHDDQNICTSEDRADKEEEPDGQTSKETADGAGDESAELPTGNRQEMSEHQQAPTTARDSDRDTLQPEILDSERNVSKTTPRPAEQDRPADPEAGRESPAGGTSTSERPAASPTQQETKKDDSSKDDTVINDSVAPMSIKSEEDAAVIAKNNEQSEEDLQSGEEAIVTVTMETVQTGDNFDGTKTFLTTTNLESEDWQNMVKV